ncbi:MAG: glycoside hydrolase family 16 protein [Bacteroidota bacterium]
MKQISLSLLSALLIISVFNSCNGKEQTADNTSVEEKKTTMNDKQSTDYQAGEGWTLAWADEFKGNTIDSNNWNFQVEKAGRFNEEWQRYTNSSNNAYVEDDCLVIKAIHESDTHGLDQYTSARLHTANKQAWKYGKIVARMKLPHGQGIWPAFWMLGKNIDENGGDTPWPFCGEVDILELYGTNDDGVVECNIHYANAEGKHTMMGAESFKLKEGKFADDFHIFELEWNAEKITWSVDGKAYASTSITEEERSEFHNEFFLLFNIAVGGTFAGRPDDTTPFPQYMYIDWVRVYQK